MITLDHLTRRHGSLVAVDDLSLEIPDGSICVLVGPSGCGKTTTLRMINRLIEPSGGRVLIDGVDTAGQPAHVLRRRIGYVIQQVGLFPHLTVAQNVATVPRLLGWDRRRIDERVEELLELVGLPAAEYGSRRPSALSGGQQQRVGVARALGADPPVLLMDEPFAAIDPVTRTRLQDELLRLQTVVRKTIVFVTHDIDEAMKVGDHVALLAKGGRLAQYATPADLLAAPADDFVTEFLGGNRQLRRMALLPLGRVTLLPVGPTRPATSVALTASMRDALDAVMRAPSGRVAVLDGETHVGDVDADVLRGAAA